MLHLTALVLNVRLMPVENIKKFSVYMKFGRDVYFGIPINEKEIE